MTAFMRGRGGSSGHGCFRMSRAIFSGSASPHAHCLRPRRARRDAAAAAAQCALQCMLAGTQRRRLTEWVLSVPNVRGPSTGRVGRLSACQARAALAHTPSIFRWSFFFYYSYTSLPPFPSRADPRRYHALFAHGGHRGRGRTLPRSMPRRVAAGEATYIDPKTGYKVMTSETLSKRGRLLWMRMPALPLQSPKRGDGEATGTHLSARAPPRRLL